MRVYKDLWDVMHCNRHDEGERMFAQIKHNHNKWRHHENNMHISSVENENIIALRRSASIQDFNQILLLFTVYSRSKFPHNGTRCKCYRSSLYWHERETERRRGRVGKHSWHTVWYDIAFECVNVVINQLKYNNQNLHFSSEQRLTKWNGIEVPCVRWCVLSWKLWLKDIKYNANNRNTKMVYTISIIRIDTDSNSMCNTEYGMHATRCNAHFAMHTLARSQNQEFMIAISASSITFYMRIWLTVNSLEAHECCNVWGGVSVPMCNVYGIGGGTCYQN